MAIRREIRLRKEFLLRKQRAVEEVNRTEKKRKLQAAIEEGKRIPTEIIAESRQLHHELEMDVKPIQNDDGVAWFDDEYANVGVREPKVCVTTSRDPSSRLKQFSK
jgi:U3 small nucleolar ribonucleoprotein protein IMP4